MANEEVYTGEVRTGNELVAAGMQSLSPADMQKRIANATEIIRLKREFLEKNLKEGLQNDFAVIPGTKERSLLKPGAEKLLDWHGYYASFVIEAEKEDWDLGLFAYTYRCDIRQKGSNILVGQCYGDASTWESKYRYEWKYASQFPQGTNLEQLPQRAVGKGDNVSIQYRIDVENPADKRNTVRKMAQKRAFIGATVLATATSDLFTTKDPDEGDPGGSGGTKPSAGPETKAAVLHTAVLTDEQIKKEYGDTISEPQGKRLYAIRTKAQIDPEIFKKWLLATYGLDSDKKIGRRIYEAICTACQSGHLEFPAAPAEATAEEKPADPPSDQASAPAHTEGQPGATLNAEQIKRIWAEIHTAKVTESVFNEWLGQYDKKYSGKHINTILSADCDKIIAAFKDAAKAGVLA